MNLFKEGLFDQINSLLETFTQVPTYPQVEMAFKQYNLKINREFFDYFIKLIHIDVPIYHIKLELLSNKNFSHAIKDIGDIYSILISILTDLNSYKSISKRQYIILTYVGMPFIPVVKYDYYFQGVKDFIFDIHEPIRNILKISSKKILIQSSSKITIANLETKEIHKIIYTPVQDVIILPNRIATSLMSNINILDIRTGNRLLYLQGHHSYIDFMLLLNNKIISGSHDNSLKIWDTQLIASLEGHTDRVTCGAILSKNHIISGSRDTTLRIWNIDTYECEGILRGHGREILDVKVIVKLLYNFTVVSIDGISLRIWVLNSFKEWVTDKLVNIEAISILPHGDTIICACRDYSIVILNIVTLSQVVLRGHSGTITRMDFLHNGASLISVSIDETMRIWNPRRGICEKVLYIKERINSLLVVDDKIITGSKDGTVAIWT